MKGKCLVTRDTPLNKDGVKQQFYGLTFNLISGYRSSNRTSHPRPGERAHAIDQSALARLTLGSMRSR